jgi:hypothetical protein
MPRIRMTVFMELGDVGWSEAIGCVPTDPASLSLLAQAYIIARSGILSTEAKIVDVRISDDEVFRDIIVPIAGLPRLGAQPGRAAPPSATVLLKGFTNDARVQRNFFIRGVPATLVDGRNFTPPSIWDTAFLQYAALLTGGQFLVFGKDRAQQKQAIQSVNNAGVCVLVNLSTGFASGDVVQLLGVPRSLIQHRVFTVYNQVNPLNFSLRPWQLGQVLGTQGFLRKVSIVGFPLRTVNAIDIGERKVGRPFGLPRGRAAVVR